MRHSDIQKGISAWARTWTPNVVIAMVASRKGAYKLPSRPGEQNGSVHVDWNLVSP